MFLLPNHHYSLTCEKCSVYPCCTLSLYIHITLKKNKSCSFDVSSGMLLCWFLRCVLPVPKAVQKLSFPADLIMNRCIWRNFGAVNCVNKSCLTVTASSSVICCSPTYILNASSTANFGYPLHVRFLRYFLFHMQWYLKIWTSCYCMHYYFLQYGK